MACGMERHDEQEPRDDAEATDDETPEAFAADLENDPAHNPPIDELKDVKGG